MRKLMWLSIGLMLACIPGSFCSGSIGMIALGVAAALGAVLLCLFSGEKKARQIAALVLAGLSLGSFWCRGYDALIYAPARNLDGKTRNLSLRASGYPWETDFGCAVDGSARICGKTYRVRLYLNRSAEIHPGDQIEVEAKLRFTGPGGGKNPTFHRGNGIFLLAYQQEEPEIRSGTPGVRDLPVLFRQRSLELLERFVPGEAAGFAKALLLCDRTDLSYLRKTQFSITGISHIVAVSGLHVAILFLFFYRILGKRPILTALAAIPGIVFFAAMAGFTPSVTRAAIMQSLFVLSLLVNREYDPPTALSFAAGGMLLANPMVITSVGFQLSVASVAGIFLFSGKIRSFFLECMPKVRKRSRLRRLETQFFAAVSVTMGATVLSLPLAACYFGTVSLVSVLSNLLILPVVSLVFHGSAMVVLLGTWFAPGAVLAGRAVSLLVDYIYGVTEFLAGLPFSAVYTASIYVVLWIVLCYLVAAVCLGGGKRRVLPGMICCILALGISVGASRMDAARDDYAVTALNVGQGQCIILRSGRTTWLADCGGSYDEEAANRCAAYLLSRGISRIDGVIVTHYDRDHVGGVPYLMQRMQVDRVYLPRVSGVEVWQAALSCIPGNTRVIPFREDFTAQIGSAELTVFAPDQAGSRNESCAAVLFQNGKYDTLVTGDLGTAGELRLLEQYDLPDLELLVAGHHGSKTSTSEELLYRTAPDLAFISAGENNSYGHPADEVLAKLTHYGVAIYRTDLMGNLSFRG